MKTKLFLPLLLILMVTLSCNNKNESVTLTILGEDSSNLQAMESLKDEYEKKSGLKINFEPNTFDDAYKKANNDFAYNTGLYDIVLQYNFSLSSFVRNNYVYDINGLTSNFPSEQKSFESDLFENAWKEVGYYYKNSSEEIMKVGYPFAANTMLLVYNKEMFDDSVNKADYRKTYGEELSVPTSWEQYKNIANFFTNPKQDTYGICLQGSGDGWLYYEFCNFLYGMDGAVFKKDRGWKGNENTPIVLNSENSINATKFYKSLKPFNAGNYTSIGTIEQIQILKKGNVAMGIVWSDYLFNFIYDINGKEDSRFGFAPIPGKKSALAGGSFYINKDSKNPNESVKYIMNLMQKPMQIELAKKGLCSPLKSTYENPEVKKIPYSNALRESLERGVYMFEAGPESDFVNQTLTNYIQQIWSDELTIENGLIKAQEDIARGRISIYKAIK